MRAARPLAALVVGASLVSATPAAQAPGRGVLCLGGFVYFAERTGTICHAGQDPEFQQRIARLSDRFDDYIIRNTGGDPAWLASFKTDENIDSNDRAYICGGDLTRNYEHMMAMSAAELDKGVDELLARDGPPSFGDCL